jgi:hypothetical protein
VSYLLIAERQSLITSMIYLVLPATPRFPDARNFPGPDDGLGASCPHTSP